MRIKLDENLPPKLKNVLATFGHEACTAADEGLLSQPDTRIAHAAASEKRILFTLDLEFADLRKYPPGHHPGVILFRPYGMGMRSVNSFVQEFLRGTDLSECIGCVVVVDPGRVRVRRPPLDFDSPEWKEIPFDE